MRRLHEVMSRSTASFLVWMSVLTALIFCDCTRKELQKDPYHSYFFLVLQLPLYGLVLFGSYALTQIGWHLVTLSDCNDAHKELVGQIELAKADLSKKGMKI
ncbi:dolichol-phosphate mannosyltransferase subunit 3 [Stylonychia lemnae]|uniref:Dolichol-phosphate mannosyltransferase subunit 3 n=1 Tax=Stylonychia lemnae TaxID=5949 RepID=A0A077ZSM1_STYLE|nr:dolichol-phosphate mannosyltransferase subunit 3 [Stylonychia lemnae]|eukprot:CDW72564.1 dolichol-phosphate mannosyltransferase subunit 3 [Stylonychia lemnae]